MRFLMPLFAIAMTMTTIYPPGHAADDKAQAGALSPEKAVRAKELIEALGDTDFQVREQATSELFKMGPKVVPLLSRHKNADDLEVKLRVRMLLEQLPNKVYSIVRLKKAPTVDGKIEGDDAWIGAVVQEGGFEVLKTGRTPSRPTHFRMGFTEKGIHVAVTCFEPKPGAIKAKMKDGGQIFQEDSIELFIKPEEGNAYYQFVANAIGSRWNDQKPRRHLQLKEWSAAAKQGEKSWTLEMTIPYGAIDAEMPEKGHVTWRFNICRNIHSTANQLCSWSDVKENFHEPQNFARLIFDWRADEKQ